MKIKKSLIYIVILPVLLLVASCGSKAVISGNIANAENELLELSLNSNPKTVIDTVRLNSSGKFSFKYNFKKNKAPLFFTLSVSDKPLANLLLEPGDKAILDADYKNASKYTVKGSEGSELMKELNDKMLAVTFSADSLIDILIANENTPEYNEIFKKINKEVAVLYTKYKQSLIKFIVQNNKSYASFAALYQVLPNKYEVFGKEGDAPYYKMLADSLEKKYPQSVYVYKLRDDYKMLTQIKAIQKVLENAEQISIPDITMPDIKGNQVSLSSLKGKVVLLDFWSSEDRISSMNNNELLPIYEKYHSKGFEIYQVSTDKSREKWLLTINNQKLPWINVCDFSGKDTYALGLYNVKKLPANYLISKEGEIIGKDLFGEELDKKLNEVLK